MNDSELRTAVNRFLEEQESALEKLANDLATVHDELRNQMQRFYRWQSEFIKFRQKLSNDFEFDNAPRNNESETGNLLPESNSFERALVESYNSEEPGKWRRLFGAEGFGAENVNDIWEKGGEPRFAKKEGGIYNLVAQDGVYYVVPEPGLALNDGYVKSEGLNHLFDISGYDLEMQAPVSLVKPATVEESSGGWRVSSKGAIRGKR